LGRVLIGMVSETAHHAGHADIVRELIDGQIGRDGAVAADPAFWRGQRCRVQMAADQFRTG
jgi:hypothetical protein